MNSDESQIQPQKLEKQMPPDLWDDSESPAVVTNTSVETAADDSEELTTSIEPSLETSVDNSNAPVNAAENSEVENTLVEPVTEPSDNLEEPAVLVELPVAATDEVVIDAVLLQTTEILVTNDEIARLQQQIADLQHQEQTLKQEIATLQAAKDTLLEEVAATKAALGRMIQEAVQELEKRKQTLEISVEQLERRQERIRSEMKTTFAGVSQDLAIRVQGFKDYLVGSLQDLAATAEQLDLVPKAPEPETVVIKEAKPLQEAPTPKFAESGFQEQTKQIRKLLDQYRTRPDYYGPPWQLRRTFEPIHAERASYWFFSSGGKGALRSMGSRLQNILVASSIISVLRMMYGDRLRALILANSPERLGEWRRGLQDCLGITRGDFGPEQGIVLFEAPEPLANKADRVVKDKELPLIIIDEAEDQISLSLLQFPMWLAFARDPQAPSYL